MPFIVTIFSGSCTELLKMVTFLEKEPTLLESYLTFIVVDDLGDIGVLEHMGVVHPQIPLHLEIMRGAVPRFVTSNSQNINEPFSVCATSPKS